MAIETNYWLALQESFSPARLLPYTQSCENDVEEALKLYELNSLASASLYHPLQTLEITLRNKIHHQLSHKYGDWWFDRGDVIWDLFQRRRIADAQVDLVQNRKPLTPGQVVASLMLGFWTTCLAAKYDDVLWRRGGIAKAFAAGGEKPSRKVINRMIGPIRLIRNRIAHHEPILYYDLPKHHANIVTLTKWLCPVTADWAERHSTFPNCYDTALARRMLSPAQRDQHD